MREACQIARAKRNSFVPDLERMGYSKEAQEQHRSSVETLLADRRDLRISSALERLCAFSDCLSTLEEDVATVASVGCTLASIEGDTLTARTTGSDLQTVRRPEKRKFCAEEEETGSKNKRRN